MENDPNKKISEFGKEHAKSKSVRDKEIDEMRQDLKKDIVDQTKVKRYPSGKHYVYTDKGLTNE